MGCKKICITGAKVACWGSVEWFERILSSGMCTGATRARPTETGSMKPHVLDWMSFNISIGVSVIKSQLP